MKILIVDDEPDLCDCLAMLLEQRGYQTTTAKSGIEGLEAIKINNFDLIISDIRMPDCDGIEFLHKLKTTQTPIPPFIFLSGFSELSKEEALQKGAADLIKKPMPFAEMIKIIEQYIKNL